MRVLVNMISGVPAAAGSPVIPSANIYPLYPDRPESTATEHWLLGGSSESLTGLKSGLLLTRAGAQPEYSTGYLTTVTTGLNGLVSPVIDSSEFTIACVMAFNGVSAEGGRVIMGTSQGGSGGDGRGSVLLQSSTSGLNGLARPNASQPLYPSTGTTDIVNRWSFIAYGVSTSGSKQKAFIGGLGQNEVSLASAYLPSTRGFAVGNGYYNASNYTAGMRIAEFIIFPTYMSQSDLTAVYARSKARMSARGISVY